MKTAVILSIGEEVLTGQIHDTNATWIALRLGELGIRTVRRATVGDDLRDITDAIRTAATAADILIATGGLGPTRDDLTRQALADALGEDLMTDEEALARLRRYWEKRRGEMPPTNAVQALRPPSASLIPNARGTAPGLVADLSASARAWFLPGPPVELHGMWEAHVAADLRTLAGHGTVMATRLVNAVGIPEAEVAQRLDDLMQRGRRPDVGTMVRDSLVVVRIRDTGPADAVEPAVNQTADEVARRLAPFVYGRDEMTLAEAVLDLLRERGLTLAVAESCTGGLLGSLLTEPAGASDVFLGGFITYSNEMKATLLGVPESTLAAHGAVSRPTAEAMARGAARAASGAGGRPADCALAITGVAGPGGGSEAKPVGTVYIALAAPDTLDVRRLRISGDREAVRRRSALAALALLFLHLTCGQAPPMTWESQEE